MYLLIRVTERSVFDVCYFSTCKHLCWSMEEPCANSQRNMSIPPNTTPEPSSKIRMWLFASRHIKENYKMTVNINETVTFSLYVLVITIIRCYQHRQHVRLTKSEKQLTIKFILRKKPNIIINGKNKNRTSTAEKQNAEKNPLTSIKAAVCQYSQNKSTPIFCWTSIHFSNLDIASEPTQ